ncbi:DUF177 domain-containing protein [Metabacillus sp. GX 13764]|uniref:YceD family protein n=1 Tax=Metabacillus kandeliae TaxID=2900151 RepID=UPI001E2B3EF0|nr:DUF177 domain-containing protein [Metabacillus kandeliae]MCD7033910.1 DUF177 domain-containing protein [Metabacillus kandeliae]
MKWSINELHQYQSKGLELDETIRLDELKDVHNELRKIEPVHVKGHADISSSKAAFHLLIEGTMILPCSRTLVDVRYPFKIDTTEIYLLKAMEFADEEEPEIHQLDGDSVDLIPMIKELILLEIPMQVFCDDVNEEGAAPQEGKDWQVISEEEKKAKVDPRLADLAKFFDNNKES